MLFWLKVYDVDSTNGPNQSLGQGRSRAMFAWFKSLVLFYMNSFNNLINISLFFNFCLLTMLFWLKVWRRQHEQAQPVSELEAVARRVCLIQFQFKL